MDRFPEEVYQQGRDTHLYRFLSALGGDSGVGLIKAQAFAARLIFEAEFLSFQVLDQFYAAQFRFNRLKSETYPDYDPSVDALTPTVWDTILLADQSYRQRVAEFFTATRYGTSPHGMTVVAQSGSGIECEVVENYKWIFDQFSDDVLGLTPLGSTESTSEFVVVPHFVGGEDAADFEYTQNYARGYTYNDASLPNVRPVTSGTAPSVTTSYSPTTTRTAMVPDVERNMVELLDRLRPASTLASIFPEPVRYITVPIGSIASSSADALLLEDGNPILLESGSLLLTESAGSSDSTIGGIHASSERLHINRLVTGKIGVPWPDLDPSENFFIESGVENEAAYFYGSTQELPIVFQTIESIHAYTDQALQDPLYASNEFYDASNGPADFEKYRSEQIGPFPLVLQAIYPFLSSLSIDSTFTAANAIAVVDTPLILQGKTIAA